VTNIDGGSGSGTFAISSSVDVTGVNPSTTMFGTKVFTITGTGFASGATVALDGTTVSGSFGSVAATSSTTTRTVTLATAPAVGGHTFLVTTSTGSDTGTFVVNPATTGNISDVGPDTATVGATNVTFTVTGTGFVKGRGQVTINGDLTNGTDYNIQVTISSTTSLTFTTPFAIPARDTYTVNVTVTNGDGTVTPSYPWTLMTCTNSRSCG
jgi:hypothetical protein